LKSERRAGQPSFSKGEKHGSQRDLYRGGVRSEDTHQSEPFSRFSSNMLFNKNIDFPTGSDELTWSGMLPNFSPNLNDADRSRA
jgi:hypothetical protein